VKSKLGHYRKLGAVAFGVFTFFILPLNSLRTDGWIGIRGKWWPALKNACLVSLVSWSGLFVVSTVIEVFHNHHDETGRWKAVVNEKNSLKQMLAERDKYIHQLEGRKLSVPNQVEPPLIAQLPLSSGMGLGNKELIMHTGEEAVITARTSLTSPTFRITCSVPCAYSGYGGIDTSSYATSEKLNDRTYIVAFSIPQILMRGKAVSADFRSMSDEPLSLKVVSK
jgi:hypothetical protein